MRKILKKIIVLCILTTFTFSLTGCYDATGIEENAYVVAIGLDLAESNELELTIQIATEGNNSSGGESSSSSSQSKQTNITTVKCSSINSGISLINNHISKQTNLSNCQVLVISEKLATYGIAEYIDTLLNNVELRNDCSVIISKCSAKDYLNNVKPSLEIFVARFYESTLQSAKYTGYTINISLAKFYSKMKDTSCEPYAILGAVSTESGTNSNAKLNYDNTAGENPITDSDVIDNFGIAIFKNDVLVGELSGLDSICHVMITNELDECTMSVPNPFESGKYIDLLLTSEKDTKCSVSYVNNSPLISVDIYLDGRGLSLDEHIKYDSTESLNLIESSATKYIQNQVSNYLYKTAKEYNSDICGFGKYAISNYLTLQEWNDSNWLGNYKNSFFDVNVYLNVESGNLFTKS
ncbi:MAG: Ger(x)C family spore germination protein [Clostridia bacterium]|nr:Ger(x)C family spore germination protein [Clostridia bacterium]